MRPAVLILGEIAESRVVFVEELHATDRIRCGQIACHAPVEERLQDREILVDGGVSDILGAPQFDVFDQRGRNLREQRARLDVRFPHGKRGLDIRVDASDSGRSNIHDIASVPSQT